MRGIFSNANDVHLFLIIFPRRSLYCKLVPVHYREYDVLVYLRMGVVVFFFFHFYSSSGTMEFRVDEYRVSWN